MIKNTICILAILIYGSTSFSQSTSFMQDSINTRKPKMQVVFALDATGSMSGLINAAKDKIWSIVSSLTQVQETPEIEVGLVFYRDRGDKFITKRIPLTDSMDQVYSELMEIKAQGGGDGPESVNQGLNEAVELFNWDKDSNTYKAIFLVGDYEPHMDYKNDVPYFETCKTAKSKDIVLNTILMGNNRVAEKVWKEIAICNEGAYVNVNMNANDIVIKTPYDSVIAAINDELDDLKFYYGGTESRSYSEAYKTKAKNTTKASAANVKAQRAEYNTYYYAKAAKKKQNELLSDIASDHVKLDTIKQADLPDAFKNINRDSLAIVIKAKTTLRDSLQKKLNTEIANRNVYIVGRLKNKSATEVETSLNGIIFNSIREQTKKKKIYINGKAKF